MKHKIIFIIILSLVQTFAFCLGDTAMQEIVNVRRDFFGSDNDWDDFIGQDSKAIGKTGVHISVKHLIPHRMTKSQMKGMLDKLSGNDYSAKLLESYYSENGGYYVLDSLTDRKTTGELAKVFKKFKMLDFDYHSITTARSLRPERMATSTICLIMSRISISAASISSRTAAHIYCLSRTDRIAVTCICSGSCISRI